ncbi:hypothetical protein EKO27_g11253 [Xylaria grammica]|uniref:Uncharacterized protein n=1 Tax=Xylaria grammica TaxID=363999 RepID=A0A439CNX4_9PEZI|nr:hypothetical protein EKO27_g11253 [Xylaria grammica]
MAAFASPTTSLPHLSITLPPAEPIPQPPPTPPPTPPPQAADASSPPHPRPVSLTTFPFTPPQTPSLPPADVSSPSSPSFPPISLARPESQSQSRPKRPRLLAPSSWWPRPQQPLTSWAYRLRIRSLDCFVY